MALHNMILKELVPLLRQGQRIAALGYPDILAPQSMLEELLGERMANLVYRSDAEKICKWHGLKPQSIPESVSLFKAFGATLDVFDIYPTRGGEIICDMNKMGATTGWDNYYDFVLDVGTLEHCFNIGEAAVNAACMLKCGGIIYHSNPYQMGNHGFYGLNPTWFADFYRQPGFTLLWCKLMGTADKEPFDVPLTKRFVLHGGEVNIFAAARRDELRAIGFPVQHKYAMLAAADQPGVRKDDERTKQLG